jgi:PqqA peptide cyclase
MPAATAGAQTADILKVSYRPYLLLAELTHRCPLHCPYCSNPLVTAASEELSTEDWRRVIEEAAGLGVLHVGFSGGEPLQRSDLAELISAARGAGLYSNLITSGLGLNQRRGEELKAAGLDTVQISFQSDEAGLGDRIAGAAAHEKKLAAARIVRGLGYPLTMNVVLHRANIGRMDQLIALAEDLGAERLELANTQYYGWAFRNRAALLPSRAQIVRATESARAAKERLAGKMDILFVTPDYYSERPKPCMNGWGRRYITVNPGGDVLPCPTAGEIKGLRFDNVRARSLSWIWAQSEAFNRFRGTEWMPAPCRTCDFREVDFGGCRCQAALLTGDASATDPACSLSPHREKLTSFIESIDQAGDEMEPLGGGFGGVVFRQNPALVKS